MFGLCEDDSVDLTGGTLDLEDQGTLSLMLAMLQDILRQRVTRCFPLPRYAAQYGAWAMAEDEMDPASRFFNAKVMVTDAPPVSAIDGSLHPPFFELHFMLGRVKASCSTIGQFLEVVDEAICSACEQMRTQIDIERSRS